MIEAYLRANNMFVDYNEVRSYIVLNLYLSWLVQFDDTFPHVTCSLNKKERTHLT